MMLFVVVNVAVYPLVVRTLEQAGEDAARVQLHQYSIVLFAVVLPAGAGLALVAQPLSTAMLGDAFQQIAGQVMPWVALSTFLMGIKAFYFDLAFQLGLRTSLQIWAVAVAAVTGTVLNLWWIPAFGIMGAVYATSTAYALALMVSLGLGRRFFSLPLPVSELGRIVLAALLMVVVLLVVPVGGDSWIRLGTKIGLAAVVYVVGIWFADVGQVRRRLPPTLRQTLITLKGTTR